MKKARRSTEGFPKQVFLQGLEPQSSNILAKPFRRPSKNWFVGVSGLRTILGKLSTRLTTFSME